MPGPFFSSYVAGEAGAQSFLAARFQNPRQRVEQVRLAAKRRAPDALIEVLQQQQEMLPPSTRRQENLEALSRPGTVAVLTGQQAGLFLGPLYSFYKAASAIAVARALEVESGVPCVPIFWLQTEDHDFAEINHCHVGGGGAQPLHLGLEGEASTADGAEAARVSVKHRFLGPEVLDLLARLDEHVGSLPFAGQFLDLLRRHYRPGQSVAAAFAGVMATLFAEEGLVFLDPRDSAVAKLSAPIYRQCIDSAAEISASLLERSRALSDAGFEVQVHVRADSPLLFFHAHGPLGPRFRLELRGDCWAQVGSEETASTEALHRALELEPLRFSSSALLRPIVQDALFPTAAYVGGPSEVNYFAQLPPLYAFFGLPLPLIVPRARFRCLDERTRTWLEKLELTPAELERPREQVLQDLSRSGQDYPTAQSVGDQLMSDISGRLDNLETVTASLDPNLIKAVKRTRGAISRAVSRFSTRYGRSLLERDRIASDRVQRLQFSLFPEGIPQERFYSLAYFACRYGAGTFKEKVFAHLDPFAAAVRDFQP